MRCELERLRKDAVAAYFNLLFQHSPGGIKGNEKRQNSRCSGRDSNGIPYEY
jgi:hypothetical protein